MNTSDHENTEKMMDASDHDSPAPTPHGLKRRDFLARTIAIVGASVLASAIPPALADAAKTAAPKGVPGVRQVAPGGKHSFEVKDGAFQLDGKPFQIICAEMHYPRIPEELWRDRLCKVKAMGCNTVATYVFWNMHEPKQGQFNFSGNADLAKFIRIAQQEGLWVFLRTGPYVCAEFEFGGYPGWILKNHEVRPHTAEPHFVGYVGAWFKRLAQEVGPLQVTRGGPILMSQFGNEDMTINDAAMTALHDLQIKNGFDVLLVTAETAGSPSWFQGNKPLSNSLPAINGGDDEKIIPTIQTVLPRGPYFIAESYPGWYSTWGGGKPGPNGGFPPHLEYVLSHGISISIYMFHGGTNFGFQNGGGWYGGYWPITTSYDYSAPLNEAGQITPQYRELRDIIAKHLPPGTMLPPIPADNPVIAIPRFDLTQSVSLLRSGLMTRPTRLENPVAMEDLDQSLGFINYRTHLAAGAGKLVVNGLRDHAIFMLDGEPVGEFTTRYVDKATQKLTVPEGGATLDILVENCGRQHYGDMSDADGKRKGIIGQVTFAGVPVTGWEVFNLPMDDLTKVSFSQGTSQTGPAFYKGTFETALVGDTFLDLRGWHKGVVWINGHNIGRFWHIGPQQTLYVPGPWLKQGTNKIEILDQASHETVGVEGLTRPILDELEKDLNPPIPVRNGTAPHFSDADLAAQGTFAPTEVQTVRFAPRKANLVAIEALSAHDGKNFAAIGELEILDAQGNPIDPTDWKTACVSSEESDAEFDIAENAFDNEPNTFWHSRYSRDDAAFPHLLAIRLSGQQEISGFRYTPRVGNGPGKIKDYKFYAE